MSAFKFFSAPGAGKQYADNSNYSQAVLLPNGTLKLAGQGGWHPETGVIPAEDEGAQVELTFENIARHLKEYRYDWKDVYQIRSYHLDLAGPGAEKLVKILGEKFGKGERPILTAVEVKGLYGDMKIEIEIEAWKQSTSR